jgi:TRAP-type transport system periplasmic protein
MKRFSRQGRRPLSIALAAALATVGGVAGASAQEVKLTVGTSMPPVIPLATMLTRHLKPRVEQLSDGKVKMDVHLRGTLCNEGSCMDQVRLGQIDMATISTANYGGYGTTFEITTLPYIFKDEATAEKVFNDFLVETLKAEAAKKEGIKVLTLVPVLGFRNLQYAGDIIRTPDDMRKRKFRVTTSPLDGGLLDAWGATAVPIAWGQTYDALQTKVVSGVYVQTPMYLAMKFDEVAPSITDTAGAYTPMLIFMDLKRFERLPDFARQAIETAARELQANSFRIDAEGTKPWSEKLKTSNVKVYTPTADEMKLWRKAAARSWLAGAGRYDKGLALKILQAQPGQEDLIAELRSIGAL